VVGIDVAKAWLDVAVGPSTPAEVPWRVANRDAAIPALVEQLNALAPQIIVLEATGGYERLVVARLAEAGLAEAGLPVAVVNPRQVRDARQGDRAAGQNRPP
jgi:transposase